jgi:hypothetical protein
MATMTRAGLLAAISLLVGAACSSSGSGPSSTGAINSVADLGAAITSAFCSRQLRCCTAIEITALEGNAYRTEAACTESGVSLAVRDQLALAGDAVANGLIALDATVASACLDAYRQQPCPSPAGVLQPAPQPDVGAIVTACPGLFLGKIPIGLRCDMTAECTSGAHCVTSTALGGTSSGGGPTPTTPAFGVCEPYGASGDPCNDTGDCDPRAGLVCRALDGTCALPAGANEPCAPSPTSASAPPTIPCAAGLFCDAGALVCRNLPRAGEPCLTSIGTEVRPICDPDPSLALACVGAGINGSGFCLTSAQAGEACGGEALPTCASGLVCVPTQGDGIGTCGPAPGVGAACAPGGVCAGSAVCDAITALCTIPGPTAIGQPCTTNPDCVSLSCLVTPGKGGICGPPRLAAVTCIGNGTTPEAY